MGLIKDKRLDTDCRSSVLQLSDHTWLKGAKRKEFLAQSLLVDVPPVVDRQELRESCGHLGRH